MEENLIKEMLDGLAELQAEIDSQNLAEQELLDAVLTPEIKARMAEIRAEFAGKIEVARGKMGALTADIKTAVLENGVTMKGSHLMAVWNKGRVSWDLSGMDGYFVSHPEIAFLRKEGEPSVTIRKV